MKIEKIGYSQVSAISFKDLSYINLESFLDNFYSYRPEIASFAKIIEDRKKFPVDRKLLVDVLKDDYKYFEPTSLQNQNIESLSDEHTFTIVTAHQPSLFGGPLYYVLKIASVVNLCRQLKNQYPDYHFVPTFVNGGEDHDFDEIDHLNLFGKSIKWNREAKGPVGRLSTDGLFEVIEEVGDILGDKPTSGFLKEVLSGSLAESKTYSDFVFKFVNKLFGKYGVLAVNMDNAKFKKKFAPVMKREILERISKTLVTDTQNELEHHKFKAQAFPRDINLFYICEAGRKRLEPNGDSYEIVDTDKTFTQEEILSELERSPEKFSPNVVMRPIYQETILPNLAYVGGGGEIAYWLERKSQFNAYNSFFPMLIRRNSAMILNKGHLKNMNKLGFGVEDLFKDKDRLVDQFIQANADINVELNEEKERIENAYRKIAEKSASVDPSLSKSVLAEMTRQLKSIDQMESRIKRTLKSQQEVNVNKIGKLKEKLFPNNGLQERYDNFMSHYLDIGEEFFDMLVDNLDPMDRRFTCFLPDM